jgi:hypothetical protein
MHFKRRLGGEEYKEEDNRISLWINSRLLFGYYSTSPGLEFDSRVDKVSALFPLTSIKSSCSPGTRSTRQLDSITSPWDGYVQYKNASQERIEFFSSNTMEYTRAKESKNLE